MTAVQSQSSFPTPTRAPASHWYLCSIRIFTFSSNFIKTETPVYILFYLASFPWERVAGHMNIAAVIIHTQVFARVDSLLDIELLGRWAPELSKIPLDRTLPFEEL